MSVNHGAAVYLGYILKNPHIDEDTWNHLVDNSNLHVIDMYTPNEKVILGECISAVDNSAAESIATSGNIDEVFGHESTIRAMYADIMHLPFEQVDKPSLILAATID